MEFFDAVKKRASVRSFAPGEVSAEDLERIVDAGRRAPSGYNRQPCEFIMIRDQDLLQDLGKIQGCIAEAGAAVAVVVDDHATRFWKEDASAAIENMLLAVVALGYASVWVEGYVLKHEGLGKDLLDVPDDRRLLAILPIGSPATPPGQADKAPLSEVAYVDRYGQRLTADD
jgi:nitroreductase